MKSICRNNRVSIKTNNTVTVKANLHLCKNARKHVGVETQRSDSWVSAAPRGSLQNLSYARDVIKKEETLHWSKYERERF